MGGLESGFVTVAVVLTDLRYPHSPSVNSSNDGSPGRERWRVCRVSRWVEPVEGRGEGSMSTTVMYISIQYNRPEENTL